MLPSAIRKANVETNNKARTPKILLAFSIIGTHFQHRVLGFVRRSRICFAAAAHQTELAKPRGGNSGQITDRAGARPPPFAHVHLSSKESPPI
jgi:hypothetical protein